MHIKNIHIFTRSKTANIVRAHDVVIGVLLTRVVVARVCLAPDASLDTLSLAIHMRTQPGAGLAGRGEFPAEADAAHVHGRGHARTDGFSSVATLLAGGLQPCK